MSSTLPTPPATRTRLPRSHLARRLVVSRLQRITDGTLWIRDDQGETRIEGVNPGPRAVITVHDPVLWTDVLGAGVLGAGEAYTAGAWSADDLPAAMQVMLRNRHVIESLDSGLARVSRPLRKLAHRFRRNSREACRKYIAAHYDLGNEFFALFLDETMTYSAGVFEHPRASLEEAQRAKYERLCRKLDLRPGMRVLEIGCGWGGFAEHAATVHGCRVTATTISSRQFEYARNRIAAKGLGRQVDVQCVDYRDLRGTYDRVVSIEMVEAIGDRWLPRFAEVCAERLAPDGALGLQAITIDDRHYDRARKTEDFIKRYVFPGSFIPSTAVLQAAFSRRTDMSLLDLEDIGLDYAETLARWRSRFHARAQEIAALGFDADARRLWDYYFAYCEGGFRERFLGTVQMVWSRPRSRLVPRRVAAMRGSLPGVEGGATVTRAPR
jgi:cyclopropane-fatty-acyl-phospholipid synthase